MGLYKKPVSQRLFVKSRKTGQDVRRTKTRRVQARSRPQAINGNNPQRSLTHYGVGFPDSFKTTLVWSDNLSLDPSAGTPCPSAGFRLTSPYDPVFALGGSQPYCFDQLMAIYARFKVLGAKMTAVFSYSSQTAANIGPAICGIQTGEISGISSTDGAVLRMTSNVSSTLLGVNSEPKTVVVTYSPKQAFGDQLMDALTGSATADPSRNWVGWVFANPIGVDIEAPISVLLTIEYFTEFTQQYPNGGS